MRTTLSICKDSDGFVWVSSPTGIMRLTNDDCRIYQLPYKKVNSIIVKLLYQNSELLAYTNDGQIFKYNGVLDRFDPLLSLKTPGTVINGLIVDKKHQTYWLATLFGLYKCQGKNQILVSNSAQVSQIVWYKENQFLFSNPSGVYIFDTNTKKTNLLCKFPSGAHFRVSKLFLDRKKQMLWVGTMSDGLFTFHFKTSTFSKSPIPDFPRQPVLAIEPNDDGSMLIGIDGQGLWKLNDSASQVLAIYKENEDDPYSLPSNGVYDILCDRESKKVWVCTYSGGCSFFEQIPSVINQLTHQINNPNSLRNNHINAVIEDRHKNLWFATDNGISFWDTKSNQWKALYYNNQEQAQVFLSLCEDEKGRIWAGTYSSGIYLLDAQTGKELARYNSKSEPKFANDFVFDIYKDKQNNLWIGGNNSEIICYKSSTNEFKTYPFNATAAFAQVSDNKIAIASIPGLTILDTNSGKLNPQLNNYVGQDILYDKGILWLCTSGSGLIKYNLQNKSIEEYTVQSSGLTSNYVNSIMLVDGYLWLGTEKGLCRFNPADKTAVGYSSFIPLSSVAFNRNAHCRLSDGKMVWGTNQGAILFNPADLLQPSLSKGQIFLQNIFISGRSIRDDNTSNINEPLNRLSSISFSYKQNNLTFELLPLKVIGESPKFSWKMEGFDQEWSHPMNDRLLKYTNIPSGDYILKIRMYNNSLTKIISERELLVVVKPPFWATWWFRLLCFFTVAYLFYVGFRFYINRLKQRHAEDKIRFFTNTAHEIRTSLTLIKAPIDELDKSPTNSESDKYHLRLAKEQAQRLLLTTTQLLDFQKFDVGRGQMVLSKTDIVQLIASHISIHSLSAKSKNIELSFQYSPPNYLSAVDETILGKVIDNLISNAIKYSHSNSKVEVIFSGNDKLWILQVKDQGIGISSHAKKKLFHEFYRGENAVNSKIVGSGIGLILAKNYIHLHGGTIDFTSQENQGTTFKITVPFKDIIQTNELGSSRNKENSEVSAEEILLVTKENQEEDDSLKELNIMIVEDNDDLRNFMTHSLSNEFNIWIAKDGLEAWNILQKKVPDLIISDVMMPEIDGFELCRRIKSAYELSHIPIILLTALSDKSQQLHGLGLGADDYLVKPFDMSLLAQRIKSIIQNRKVIREKALKLIAEDDSGQIFTNKLNNDFVKKAVEIIRANMDNSDFAKEDFASAMNVSSSLLYKKIKSLTDQSPVDFIRSIRLNYALELLQSRKYTVTEVSEMAGFSTVKYFSSTFKKYYGKTPSEI